jgi:hypothetical protein
VLFKHPTSLCAVLAEEFGAGAAEVLNVFEIKLRFAVSILTKQSFIGSYN